MKPYNNLMLLEEDINLAPNYDADIDGLSGTGNVNYSYDALGNLTQDLSEEIQEIKWNAYGKVVEVLRTSTCQDKPDLVYVYDAFGQRIKKIVKKRVAGVLSHEKDWQETFYVRDAQGNVMAMYNHTSTFFANNYNYVNQSFSIAEWNLYGSSRLGTRNIDKQTDVVFLASRSYNWIGNTVTNEVIAPDASFTYKKYRLLGAKTFELTNHLGNVITTISDRKLMVQDAQNTGYVHHYTPEILSIGEQYAFGMSMPGRTYSVEKYRYGMNTQEKDDEIFEGAFTAEYWEYDSRVGRRWNIDPLVYEWQSPFACFNNNPIYFADPSGLEGEKGGSGTRDFAGQATGSGDKDYKPNSNVEGKGSIYRLNNLPAEQYVYKRTFKDKFRSFFKYKAKEIVNRLAKGITKVLKNIGKAIVNGLRKIEKVFEGRNGYIMTDENAKGSNNGSPGLPSKEWNVTGFLLRPIPGVYHLPNWIATKPTGANGAQIIQEEIRTAEKFISGTVNPPIDPSIQIENEQKIKNNAIMKSESALKYVYVGVKWIDSNGVLNGTVIPLNPINKKLLDESKDGFIDISKVDRK